MDVTDVIVYILNKNNNISGTGFVIAKDNIIITCSHVIQDQISQQRGEDKPEKVTVVFYKTGAKYNAIVEPQWWRDWNQGDIAILRLESTLPSNIPEIQFASYTNINEYTVKSLGFPNIDNITGIYGEGNVKGVISNKNNNLLELPSALSNNFFTLLRRLKPRFARGIVSPKFRTGLLLQLL